MPSSQLTELGLSPRRCIRARLLRGPWRLVLPRVVSRDARALDARQRFIAALLMAGPTRSSARGRRRHGTACGRSRTPRRVTVPAGDSSAARVRDVRRTRRPDPGLLARRRWPCRPALAPWQSPPASWDHRRASPRDRSGPARPPTLADCARARDRAETGGHSRRRTSSLSREPPSGEAWSVPEADLAALVRTSSVLPEMWANPRCAAAQSGCPRRTAGSTTWHWPSRSTRGSTTPGNSTGRRRVSADGSSPSTASHSSPSPLGRSSTMHARSSSGWSGPTSRRRSAPRPTVVATRRSVA